MPLYAKKKTVRVNLATGTGVTVPGTQRIVKVKKGGSYHKSLSAAQKAEVKFLLGKSEETKYAASQIATNTIIPIDTLTAPIGLVQSIFQGVPSNRRVGDSITPVKMRSQFHFFFDPAFTTTADVTVLVYILTSKKSKSIAQVLADPNISRILDNGSGTGSVAFDSANPLISEMLRVSPEDFTVLRKKKLRLIRNQGSGNLDNTSAVAPNGRSDSVSFTYNHTRLPKFKYDATVSTPTNYAPFVYVVAYPTNGTVMTGPLQPNMHIRSELFFKDA